jgi:hypothetical protein
MTAMLRCCSLAILAYADVRSGRSLRGALPGAQLPDRCTVSNARKTA